MLVILLVLLLVLLVVLLLLPLVLLLLLLVLTPASSPHLPAYLLQQPAPPRQRDRSAADCDFAEARYAGRRQL